MEGYDLQTFQQGIGLANAGKKDVANEIFEGLLQTNATDSNLYLWFAYTTPDLPKARNAIELARRYEPDNPNVSEAQSWLENQEQEQHYRRLALPPPGGTTITILATTSRYLLVTLPPKLQKLASQTLKPQEEIRWTGQPRLWSYMRGNFGLLFLVIGVIFFSVSLIVGYTSLTNLNQFRTPRGQGNAIALPLFLVVTGLANLIAAFFSFHNARHTAYMLTDRRAIIFRYGWLKSAKSYNQREIKAYNIKVVERSGGFGDLIFATQLEKFSDRDPADRMTGQRRTVFRSRDLENEMIGTFGDIGIQEIGFIGIAQVRKVEQLFLEIFDGGFVLPT